MNQIIDHAKDRNGTVGKNFSTGVKMGMEDAKKEKNEDHTDTKKSTDSKDTDHTQK